MISFKKKADPFIQTKKKQNEKLTFMLMGGPGKPVRDFSFSRRWLQVSLVGLCVTLGGGVVAGGFLLQDYNNLKCLKQENVQLASTNETQAAEIEELKTIATAVQSKMAAIEGLDSQVREKVGLEEKTTEEKESKDAPRAVAGFTTSRSLGAQALADYPAGLEEELDTLEDLKQELLDMDLKMTQQTDALLQLKDDVDKQLTKEAALPSHWPMQGKLTSSFGMRRNPTGRGTEMHTGQDIANRVGTKISAAGNGVVTFAGYKSGWGSMILISHGYGYVSQYAHCSQLLVKEGQKVQAGDVIGKCGTSGRVTGPHLHFGIQLNGQWINPLDVLKK